MPKTEVRQFRVTDSKLIMHSEVVYTTFVKCQSKFTSFNPTIFTPEYHDNLRAAIENASAQMSDEFVIEMQVGETKGVQQAVESVMAALKELKYFVTTAFDKDDKEIGRFKLTNLSKRKNNIDGFIGFLIDLIDVTTVFQEKLEAGGYGAEKREALQQKVNHLRAQKREQEEMKITRTKLTEKRITKMNSLWQKLVDINSASEILFADDPEQAKLFELPRKVQGSKVVIADEEAVGGE